MKTKQELLLDAEVKKVVGWLAQRLGRGVICCVIEPRAENAAEAFFVLHAAANNAMTEEFRRHLAAVGEACREKWAGLVCFKDNG